MSDETQEPITNNTDRRLMHWWQDWKWIASIAAVLAAVALSTLAITSVHTNTTVDQNSPVFAEIKRLAEQNNTTLSQLQHNQAGIDELVNFVHEVEAQQTQQGQSHIAQDLITILCSSSDPQQQEACDRLGYGGR